MSDVHARGDALRVRERCGGAGRLRIGRERGTNIVVGGDLFAGVGQSAYFAFTFFPEPRLSVMAQAKVFNQAIDGGDPMFRAVAQGGYRVTPWLTLSLRGSHQLRNVTHDGFGAGFATTLDW